MTQFARPSGTLSGSWTATGAPTAWQAIGESVRDDATYATSPNLSFGISDTADYSMTSVVVPPTKTGWVLRVVMRYAGDFVPVAAQMSFQQGATTITILNADNILTTSFVEYTKTLTSAEASLLTSAGGTHFTSFIQGDPSSLSSAIDISYAVLELPDAVAVSTAAPFYDIFLWTRPDE